MTKKAIRYLDLKRHQYKEFGLIYFLWLLLGPLGLIAMLYIYIHIEHYNQNITRDIEQYLMSKKIELFEYEMWRAEKIDKSENIRIKKSTFEILIILGISLMLIGTIIFCVGNYANFITITRPNGDFSNVHWGAGLKYVGSAFKLGNSFTDQYGDLITNAETAAIFVVMGATTLMFWGLYSIGCIIYFLKKQFGWKINFEKE